MKEIDIAILDTDFIEKCQKITLGTSCLLERFFETSIEEAMCHEAVLKECAQGKTGSQEYQFLEKMIEMGRIQIRSDIELMSDDTQESIRQYLFTYSKMLSILFPHNGKLLEAFQQIFARMEYFKTREQVVFELQTIEDLITNHYGEFKTCILISYMLEYYQKKVCYFCSDDKGAHSKISSLYCNSVKAIKPYAVIVYCFNKGFLTNEEAIHAMQNSELIGAVRYRERDGKVVYCTAEVFLDYLFHNSLDCSAFGDALLRAYQHPNK